MTTKAKASEITFKFNHKEGDLADALGIETARAIEIHDLIQKAAKSLVFDPEGYKYYSEAIEYLLNELKPKGYEEVVYIGVNFQKAFDDLIVEYMKRQLKEELLGAFIGNIPVVVLDWK